MAFNLEKYQAKSSVGNTVASPSIYSYDAASDDVEVANYFDEAFAENQLLANDMILVGNNGAASAGYLYIVTDITAGVVTVAKIA